MKPLILLLFVICFWNLPGQMPSNFEFLYHEDQNSRLGASHVTPEGVLFVSHNASSIATTVNLARYDNTIEVLFESI